MEREGWEMERGRFRNGISLWHIDKHGVLLTERERVRERERERERERQRETDRQTDRQTDRESNLKSPLNCGQYLCNKNTLTLSFYFKTHLSLCKYNKFIQILHRV